MRNERPLALCRDRGVGWTPRRLAPAVRGRASSAHSACTTSASYSVTPCVIHHGENSRFWRASRDRERAAGRLPAARGRGRGGGGRSGGVPGSRETCARPDHKVVGFSQDTSLNETKLTTDTNPDGGGEGLGGGGEGGGGEGLGGDCDGDVGKAAGCEGGEGRGGEGGGGEGGGDHSGAPVQTAGGGGVRNEAFKGACKARLTRGNTGRGRAGHKG